ncbi:MAG: PAS domain S-box protein [Candidatus Omnitrophica bacterium]|nr:PAS domain S-box protein [Candidatus Omnitrophota bacterium]
MDLNTKEMEQSLYRLIDGANLLALYLDRHGRILICNKKTQDMAARPKEEIIGREWPSILFRNDNAAMKQQMFKAVMEDSVTYKRSNNFEGLIIDANNNERLISWNISPILSASGELEGTFLVGNDITELKEKEASLKKIDETLKNIFSSIKEYALCVINLDGNITYFGMGAEAMLGWQKNDIIFKHISALFAAADVKAQLPVILERVRDAGKYETEAELVTRRGQRFPVSLTVGKFLDPENKLIGYIFMAKDITERKRLEYQIFQAEKLAAIGQLAAGMAHEINNPLFVISGRLEMILEGERLTGELKKDLNIINAQADRIRKLVDRLLKFARQPVPKLEIININEAIEAVLPFLSYHKSLMSKINIDKDFAGSLRPIKGDLNQLQEVFMNLFLNAYQAMPEGGRLTIKTSNFMDSFAEIRISDTGSGISPENLKNVFMPFFSTKKDGTGLGLSICYNIIKSHNGSIDVESQPNKGTTFIVRLPFA